MRLHYRKGAQGKHKPQSKPKEGVYLSGAEPQRTPKGVTLSQTPPYPSRLHCAGPSDQVKEPGAEAPKLSTSPALPQRDRWLDAKETDRTT